MVRAFAFHQCGPGSNPGVGAICGYYLFLLILSLAPRGFSPGTPVFLSLKKPTLPDSNSIWNTRTCLSKFLRTRDLLLGQSRSQTLRSFWSAPRITKKNPKNLLLQITLQIKKTVSVRKIEKKPSTNLLIPFLCSLALDYHQHYFHCQHCYHHPHHHYHHQKTSILQKERNNQVISVCSSRL